MVLYYGTSAYISAAAFDMVLHYGRSACLSAAALYGIVLWVQVLV
jgi:hypothetical protein